MAQFNPFLHLSLWVFLNNEWCFLQHVHVRWISWSKDRAPLFMLETFLQKGQMLLDMPWGVNFELRTTYGPPDVYEDGRAVVTLSYCNFVDAITNEPMGFDSVAKIQVRFECEKATICES